MGWDSAAVLLMPNSWLASSMKTEFRRLRYQQARPSEERNSAQQRLRDRSVNFIFVVDLYNEGIDIPEVDTVLFLRPTESLTVFLQQLGRGLRLHPEKECLTVLDFIGRNAKSFGSLAGFVP